MVAPSCSAHPFGVSLHRARGLTVRSRGFLELRVLPASYHNPLVHNI